MSKISKHPHHDDPSAFGKRFPRIERLTDTSSLLSKATSIKEQAYKMGVLRITIAEPQEEMPKYLLMVHGRERYPDWDSIVWIRYNLIPDAARMALILPNLNSYINNESTHHRVVFTIEQVGWAVDPYPVCESCGEKMVFQKIEKTTGFLLCKQCDKQLEINLATWNEDHGNGFLGRKKE